VRGICKLARERRALRGRAGFRRGRARWLNTSVCRAAEPVQSEHWGGETRCPQQALQWPQLFQRQVVLAELTLLPGENPISQQLPGSREPPLAGPSPARPGGSRLPVSSELRRG